MMGSSRCIEKREDFFGGGAGAGASLPATGFEDVAGAAAVVCLSVVDFGVVFFLLLFLLTERGLNIIGLPTILTSSAGFCPSGIVGSACFFGGGKLSPDEAPACDPSEVWVSSPSREKAGAAPVFKLTPALALPWPRPPDGLAFGFLGGGKNELKPEKRPPAPAPVRARFAGGSSPCCVLVAVGRLTTILPGLDRSTTFWKGFLDVALVDDGLEDVVDGLGGGASDSESEEA